MKLLVILLSLASERYLVHVLSLRRSKYLHAYCDALMQRLPVKGFMANPYVLLAGVVLPLLVLLLLLLHFLSHGLFGLFGFILNLIVFYLCLGPGNPFYPERSDDADEHASARYFSEANGQLFAVILWFIIAGPVAVLLYRLIAICQDYARTEKPARLIIGCLDWISTRVTVLLYLLVGNFQQGFQYYRKHFFSPMIENQSLLEECGTLAAATKEGEAVDLPNAQTLVEHALVLYLVIVAAFTLVAWL